MLTKIIIVLIVIVVIVLIAAALMPRNYKVHREITINKPTQEVFNYIKYLRNEEQYNKWVMQDPFMEKEFTGIDGTVGFIYAWDSQNKDAGKGAQEIKSIAEGKEMTTEVRFIKPFEGLAQISKSTEAVSPTQTKVSWQMSSKMSYPVNIMIPFISGKLGKDLDSSLVMLKQNLEKS